MSLPLTQGKNISLSIKTLKNKFIAICLPIYYRYVRHIMVLGRTVNGAATLEVCECERTAELFDFK